jgi:transposase
MRKGFNGLYGWVSQKLGEDPRSGTLFAFTNKSRTRLKVLYWDGSGLWLLSKRLERGTFSWPSIGQAQAPKLHLAPEAWAMLTDGIDLRGAKMRPWYRRPGCDEARENSSGPVTGGEESKKAS